MSPASSATRRASAASPLATSATSLPFRTSSSSCPPAPESVSKPGGAATCGPSATGAGARGACSGKLGRCVATSLRGCVWPPVVAAARSFGATSCVPPSPNV